MYAFLDRPVSDLAPHDRLLLDAMRGWALAATLGRDPAATVAARTPQLERAGALAAFDGAMAALDTGSADPLAFQRPCHETVDETEAVLLAVIRDAGEGRVEAAARTLALMVDAPSADRAAILFAEAGRRTGMVVAFTR